MTKGRLLIPLLVVIAVGARGGVAAGPDEPRGGDVAPLSEGLFSTRFGELDVPTGLLREERGRTGGEGSGDAEPPQEKEWHITLAPYAWLLGLDGDVRVRNVDADVDMSFRDILKQLNFVLEGRVEAFHRSGWGIVFDGTYGNLEDDDSVGPLDIDVETDLYLVGLSAVRVLYDGPYLDDSERNLRLEGTVGVAWVDLETTLDLSVGPSARLDEDWVDLVVGGRATAEVLKQSLVRVAGFAGGFGIGDSSDLSLGSELLYGYRFGRELNWTAVAGYRVFYVDYERSRFEFDVLIHGPVIGLAYTF